MFPFRRAACFLFVALVGCGGADKGPPTYPVSGVVTIHGKPLANAEVVLMRDDGKLDGHHSGSGLTDDQGRVTIQNGYGADGLPTGLYRASVSFPESRSGGERATKGDEKSKSASPAGASTIPKDYQLQPSTPLRVEVVPPSTEFKLDIK